MRETWAIGRKPPSALRFARPPVSARVTSSAMLVTSSGPGSSSYAKATGVLSVQRELSLLAFRCVFILRKRSMAALVAGTVDVRSPPGCRPAGQPPGPRRRRSASWRGKGSKAGVTMARGFPWRFIALLVKAGAAALSLGDEDSSTSLFSFPRARTAIYVAPLNVQ